MSIHHVVATSHVRDGKFVHCASDAMNSITPASTGWCGNYMQVCRAAPLCGIWRMLPRTALGRRLPHWPRIACLSPGRCGLPNLTITHRHVSRMTLAGGNNGWSSLLIWVCCCISGCPTEPHRVVILVHASDHSRLAAFGKYPAGVCKGNILQPFEVSDLLLRHSRMLKQSWSA